MEGFGAENAQLLVKSDAPEGIDVGSSFALELRLHIERGYGEALYRGRRASEGRLRETVYSTESGSEDAFDEYVADSETGEISHADLEKSLPSEIVGRDGGEALASAGGGDNDGEDPSQ
jgi:hypothetical protein